MHVVNALTTIALLILAAREWRAARRMNAAAEQLRADDRAITDPTLRRHVYDDHRRLRGAR